MFEKRFILSNVLSIDIYIDINICDLISNYAYYKSGNKVNKLPMSCVFNQFYIVICHFGFIFKDSNYD